jgi:hypothetical protein
MNQKYEMTMQRKMRNTMAFGPDAQNEDMYTGETFGLSGAQASGITRNAAVKQNQKILKKRPNPFQFDS